MHGHITRRTVLGSGLALQAHGAHAAEGAEEPLQAAASAHGRFYGAAVQQEHLAADDGFAAAILQECAWLTPELALKWGAVEPARGELRLAAMDDLADFARRHRRRLHGHTLLWHRSIPAWAERALHEQADWSLVHRHFASVMPRYGDVIRTWDVVNEPVEPENGADGLRASPFLRAFGPAYIRRALESARMFAPHAKLMINEFGLEYDDPRDAARRARLLRLVDELRQAGAPLDGVGLQAHLDLRRGRLAQEALRGFLRELAARGLFILVTELDVKEALYAQPVAQRDDTVAAAAGAYLDVVLDEPAVRGVITWGLSDRYSWLKVTPEDLAASGGAWSEGRGPGLNRGLPLDAALRRKPMHASLRAAFRAGRRAEPAA